MSSVEKQIFKNGSTTFYLSSKLFPRTVRQDIRKLYSFLRVADDYVDTKPQNKKEFKILRALWHEAADNPAFDFQVSAFDSLNERVVKNMAYLTDKYNLETNWVDAFLDSMQADLDKKTYESLDGTLWYVYGSAEVVGLIMAKFMGLSKKSQKYAAVQGRAMQWINFIRDIDEDNKLGRSYFPADDLKKFGLNNLSVKTVQAQPKEFKDFINFQLNRYRSWQREAEKGYEHIPKRLRTPLETAVDNFNWTARKIANNPMLVYDKKVEPTKSRLLLNGVKRYIKR